MNPHNDAKKDNSQGLKIVFNDKAAFAFFYKKTEKITTAVYMVTAFIKDEDHLKWQLRRKGLDLLSLTLSFSHLELFDKKEGQKIAALLLEMISLFEIAFAGKMVSEMNFTILKEEFLVLLTILEGEIFSDPSRSLILSNDFFNIENMSKGSALQNEGSYKGHTNESKGHLKESVLIDRGQPKTSSQRTSSGPIKNTHKNSASDRKSIILDLFKTKKEIGVTDLSDLIKGCSEKTIQRELLGMVKDGVLKKQGERRWSKYVRA